MPNYTTSIWSESAPAPRYPALPGDPSTEVGDVFDVAIIGGGVTGITAARLLARAGRRVVLLEARRLGIDVELTADVPLPFPVAGAVRFANQAQIHPRAYLHGLADGLAGDGCAIFEQTQVVDVEEGEPCRVVTERGVVRAREVIV